MMRFNRSAFGNWPSGPRSIVSRRGSRGLLRLTNLFGFGAGGGSASYGIDYSMLFRAPNAPSFSRTFSAAPTNDKIQTLSMWFRRGLVTQTDSVITNVMMSQATTGGGGYPTFELGFEPSGDGLVVMNRSAAFSYNFRYVTSAQFRDPLAWSHLVIQYDSTQGTASNRCRIYINGVQVTSFSASTDPSLNLVSQLCNNVSSQPTYLGMLVASARHFDGEMTEIYFVDGQALTPSSFGKTDAASGQWVPKAYSGTYGTNGFYLKFADASAATAAAIGKDSSGNGNNWTPSGISVTTGVAFDQSLDTPTNKHALLSSINTYNAPTLTAGVDISSSSATVRSAAGTMAITRKTYFEGKANSVGVGKTIIFGVGSKPFIGDYSANLDTDAAAWIGMISSSTRYTGNGSSTSRGGGATNDTIQFAVDPPNGNLWVGFNNSWVGGGDPATGTSPTFTGLPATVFILASAYNTSGSLNTGQRAYDYTAPTGFLSLNTFNMATPAVPKATNGFVSVLDTESNIDATLATARAAFSSYVSILKNRSNSETWAWQFSHDSTQEYAVSATATRQAKRSNSGADNWVGHSLNISSTYGTAAGSQAHTNGVADTITHNLGCSRYAILLFPRAGGDVYFYHADLTAGNLLRINNVAAQAASTVITSVGTNSFQIGTGPASGTYDYLVIGEVDGFSKVFSLTGNASTEGPMAWFGERPAMTIAKNADSASGVWLAFDELRDPHNAMNHNLYLDQSAAEDTANVRYDYVSGGLKVRNSNVSENGSGNKIVGVAFAKAAFKYASAR